MSESKPVDMLLFCPECHYQHVDGPDLSAEWCDPAHKSHSCFRCGCVWRPADVPTNGVPVIVTRGKCDTWKRSNALKVQEIALVVREWLNARVAGLVAVGFKFKNEWRADDELAAPVLVVLTKEPLAEPITIPAGATCGLSVVFETVSSQL